MNDLGASEQAADGMRPTARRNTHRTASRKCPRPKIQSDAVESRGADEDIARRPGGGGKHYRGPVLFPMTLPPTCFPI